MPTTPQRIVITIHPNGRVEGDVDGRVIVHPVEIAPPIAGARFGAGSLRDRCVSVIDQALRTAGAGPR